MLATEVALRPAGSADAAEIAEIFLRGPRRRHALPAGCTRTTRFGGWIRDVVLPGDEVVVAEVDGRLAGFAALDEDLLDHIYVHPELQGRGSVTRASRQVGCARAASASGSSSATRAPGASTSGAACASSS